MHINKILMALLCGMMMVVMSGCFGSKAPDRTYFSIDYALTEQPHYETPKFDASIVVHSFTTANAYDRQEIVYRANPYEFQYYWYRLWAAKPRKMLRELVSKHLRHTNIFSDVTLAIEDHVPDYEMDAEIISIEELDVSSSEWYAHLAMRITVSSFDERNVIWSRDIDVKHPVADNKPVYVVKAMSEILEVELKNAFADLEKTIEKRPKSSSRSRQLIDKSAFFETDSDDVDEKEESVSDTVETVSDVPRATLKNKR